MGKDQSLNDIGKGAYAALAEMVAALECDYDRLEGLRDESKDLTDAVEANDDDAAVAARAWLDENGEELKELEDTAGDCKDREDAETRIQDDALSVEVRSDWQGVGETLEPTEFTILLTTGGPAVRIMGELDRNEPSRAWLEVQDWGTPWTRYFDADQDVLLAYSRCFYFGE